VPKKLTFSMVAAINRKNGVKYTETARITRSGLALSPHRAPMASPASPASHAIGLIPQAGDRNWTTKWTTVRQVRNAV
jgi:hypothetical protein